MINHSEKHESPVGILTISVNERAVTGVHFGNKAAPVNNFIGKKSFIFTKTEKNELIAETMRQLDEYFAGKRKSFDLPLELSGTEFQKRVWRTLQTIPYGETRSYREIAEMSGCPKACRAVGMANNRNPISIIIPCHRVIGADGSLTGYGGGLENKEFLLNLEKGNLPPILRRGISN